MVFATESYIKFDASENMTVVRLVDVKLVEIGKSQ